MSRLHVQGSQQNTTLLLSTKWQNINVVDGLHAHLLLALTFPDGDEAMTVSIEIRAGVKPRATGSLMVNVSRGAIQISGGFKGATRATLRNSSNVELEIFIEMMVP